MADIPGPSTSKGVSVKKTGGGTLKNTDSSVDESTKKRTRRKLRGKRKKTTADPKRTSLNHLNSECDDDTDEAVTITKSFRLELEIEPVKKPKGIVYKLRSKLSKHVNLQSFVTNNQLPYVFQTGVGRCSPNFLLPKLEKLSINGLRKFPIGQQEKPNRDKAKRRSSENEKKTVATTFSDYLPKDQVETGLENGDLIKGAIRINPKNFKEAYVGNEDASNKDYIIITVEDRNRALDGDEVIVRRKSEDFEGRKTVEVVQVIKEVHPRLGVGVLRPIKKNKEFAEFSPRDRRIPKIRIPKISWPGGFQKNPELYENILFVAQITTWTNTKYAEGVLTENLGLTGNLKVESLAILREFCLDTTPYGHEIREFLPHTAKIPESEFLYREDARRECVFTIDPATARDLDDAVSCKDLPNGNLEIGVHISDASYYLKENTTLDEIVKNKATTIYMVDSVYHMLPVELCLHCSLLPGQDKLAFSVFWEMTPDGDIINKRITRTIINSCVQLAYEHAQTMIDDPNKQFGDDELPTIHNDFTSDDLKRVVNNLQRIAVRLREKRVENGALRIDQVKILFSLDPNDGEPLNFFIYENKASHRLIEEFMLLANITVAEAIHAAYPDLALLRLHDPPKQTMLDELQRNLETLGIFIDISSSGGINSSLAKYVSDDYLGRARLTVLNQLLAKPMMRAKYFCSGELAEHMTFEHYALSVPIYTHFTSPIRRYADIMVHRLLAASLGYREKPNYSSTEVGEIAVNCNRQKYHAKRAGDASSELYLSHYIENHQPYVQEAVVVDVKERSVDVIVLNTGSTVRIYTNNFGEGVRWDTEQIKCAHAEDEKDGNSKKLWRIKVVFPKTRKEPAVFLVLEIFTLVTVALERKAKGNKLEGKLLRPPPRLPL